MNIVKKKVVIIMGGGGHVQGLVRVGLGLGSILWATVDHRPGSWSSHSA